jgi:hypothetical protein
MKLYHGSKKKVRKLKKQQAWNPPGTPHEEGLNGIYLTPDFAFALVSAARPLGITEVNHKERTVHFENPLSKDLTIYIYVVDSEKIPSSKLRWIDQYQVLVDVEELKPDKIETYKAGEVLKYYTIL